jgi:hypothetical protein
MGGVRDKVSLSVLKGEVKPSRIENGILFQDARLADFMRNDSYVVESVLQFESYEETPSPNIIKISDSSYTRYFACCQASALP